MLRTLLLVIFIAEVGMVALFLFFLVLTGGDLTAITVGTFTEPEINVLLWCLIVPGGLLLVVAGQRFSSLCPGLWGILLILIGTIAGSVLSLVTVSYQNVCCKFAYTIINGYPIAGVARSVVRDIYVPWSQIYPYMQRYPGQVQWEISWTSLILNGMFYANASLLLVVVLQFGARRFVQLRKGLRS